MLHVYSFSFLYFKVRILISFCNLFFNQSPSMQVEIELYSSHIHSLFITLVILRNVLIITFTLAKLYVRGQL